MKKFFITQILVAAFLVMISGTSFAATVVFNTSNHKYHSLSCKWAQKCTKNCIKIDKNDAIKRGGIPCKVCGGR